MPMIGRHNVENALCAVALAGEVFGLSVHQLAAGLKHAHGAPGRLQVIRAGQPFGDITRDDILDNVTLYWLTNTALSSARLYWENKLSFFGIKNVPVSVPVAVSAFPEELYQAPRSWAARAYPKLIYYNKPDKGGHFAAWEQPQLFSQELREGFRSLRKTGA